MKTAKTISSYIALYPQSTQVLLKRIHSTIKKSAPKAEEKIAYGIPTFTFYGNLVHFGGYEHHIGFYPGPGAIKIFKKELSGYKTSKGTIQFPIDKPLPFSLITKIVKWRVQESMNAYAKKSGVIFHKDGSIWAKGKKIDGKMNGYWEWYRKDGTKMRSGYFKSDVQTGKWTTYNKKGKVHKVTIIS